MTNEQIFEELIQLEMVFREGKLRDEARLMARKRRSLLIDLLKVNQEEAATSAALQALCRAWEDELAGQTPEIELGSCLQGLDSPPDPAVMAEKLKIAAAAELGRQIAYLARGSATPSPRQSLDLAAVVFREAMRGRPRRGRVQNVPRPKAEWVDMLPANKLGQKGPAGQMSLYYKLGVRTGFVVEWTSDLRKACQAVGVNTHGYGSFHCFSFKEGQAPLHAETMEEAKRKLEEFLADMGETTAPMAEDSDSEPPSAGGERKCKCGGFSQP